MLAGYFLWVDGRLPLETPLEFTVGMFQYLHALPKFLSFEPIIQLLKWRWIRTNSDTNYLVE